MRPADEPGGAEPQDGRRFEPRDRPESEIHLDPVDKAEDRLPRTLAELNECLHDAAEIVTMGRARFDSDWVVRRAAENVVSELAETVGRLPDRVRQSHTEIPWRDIAGMRNIVVHQCQRTDPNVLWNALAADLPAVGDALGLAES